jgi:hypothetical protein
VPSAYRTAYQMLGSWAVAKDDGPGSKQLHVVYASPGTIAAYRKDEHFPDGTVLVKEVSDTDTKAEAPGGIGEAPTAIVSAAVTNAIFAATEVVVLVHAGHPLRVAAPTG